MSSHRKQRTELSNDDLFDLYANFVVLDSEIDVFRFAHLSVWEFLETKGGYESGIAVRLWLDPAPTTFR